MPGGTLSHLSNPLVEDNDVYLVKIYIWPLLVFLIKAYCSRTQTVGYYSDTSKVILLK